MDSLPPEMIHHIMFSFDTSAADVLALALTSHTLYATLLGPLDDENGYDLAQFRAKGGLEMCINHNWVRGVKIALSRGYGDPSAYIAAPFFRRPRSTISLFQGYPVFWAACEGHADVVRAMLEGYPEVDPSVSGNCALKDAAYRGFADVVGVLLTDGRVDPMDASVYDCTALELAVVGGHVDVVRVLLDDVRVDPGVSNRALSMAAMSGFAEIVGLFLAHPRVVLGDADEHTLCLDVVRLLMEDPEFESPSSHCGGLHQAAEHGYLDAIPLLLDHPAVDPAGDTNHAIRQAAEKGHTAIVSLLLSDPRVDPSDFGNMALLQAVEEGHTDIVRLLLSDPRVDPSSNDNHAYDLAVQLDHTEIISLLSGTST